MDNPRVPGMIKVLIGATILIVLTWKLPLLEIFTIFFYFFVIPLAFMSALGLVASGTVDAVGMEWNKMVERVNQEIGKAREEEPKTS